MSGPGTSGPGTSGPGTSGPALSDPGLRDPGMSGPALCASARVELLSRGKYLAVPSRRRPLIVASWDPAVLRYLAASVLSVPPGAGPVLTLLVTIGLRVFRHPGSMFLARPLRIRAKLVTTAG